MSGHHCGNEDEGNHVLSKVCVDSEYMVLCTDHNEYHMPNARCETCLNIIGSATRRAKKAADETKKEKEKEKAFVPCKANDWNWSLAVQSLTKPFKMGKRKGKVQDSGKEKGEWGHAVM